MKFNCFFISWNYCMMISFYDGESGALRGLADILSPHTASLWEALAVGNTFFSQVSWFGTRQDMEIWWVNFHIPYTNSNSRTSWMRRSSCWLHKISLYYQWEGKWQRMRTNGEVNCDSVYSKGFFSWYSLILPPLSLQSIHWMCYISQNDHKF